MESWKRKLRMGMVGGGQGAFIGWVHRMAAAMDQQVDFIAGCFSRDFENTKTTGEQLYLDPTRCYRTYQEMADTEAKLPENQGIDFVSIVTPNDSHFAIAKSFLDAGIHVVCDKPMTYTLEEAEDLVNLVLAVQGTYVAVIFIGQLSGGFKVSFRSRCELDCSKVAGEFGGGGHKAAAGAFVDGDLATVRAKVLDAVRASLP